MKYLKFDAYSDSFNISKLALGTGSTMKQLSKDEYFRLFDIFADAGGNCLDTAPGYCGGRSVAYIGEWMKIHQNRNNIIISTKACHTFQGEPSRLTRKDMEDDLNQSLTAMQTDHVDLFWIHNDDLNWPVEDIIESINSIIKTGKVRAAGCSNWTIERIEKANKYAEENGMHGFLTSQIQWSLARVEGEAYKTAWGALVMDDMSYDWYYKNNMPVLAFSAQAQGFFAIAAKHGIEALPDNKRAFFETSDNVKRLEKVKKYMLQYNVPSSVPVLGYLINNKLPGVALMSAKTPEMLNEALIAADVDMSASEADSLFNV